MSKFKQSLLPPGTKNCDSIKSAIEMLLNCKCSEIEGKPYKKFCDDFGFDADELTLKELFAHASFMKVLEGDVSAMKFVSETVYGKPKEAEVEENPLKQLTDERLESLIKSEQKLLEGGGDG